MKLKSLAIITFLTVLLTSCPYQSNFVLGEKTELNSDLVGTYVLDSSKFIVEKLVFHIDSNSQFKLLTLSEENGEQIYTGNLVTSTIGKTKVLNIKYDLTSQYYYFKYDNKLKSLNLQFLSQNKFEIREPQSKTVLDSVYIANSKKKIWTFNVKLKKEN